MIVLLKILLVYSCEEYQERILWSLLNMTYTILYFLVLKSLL